MKGKEDLANRSGPSQAQAVRFLKFQRTGISHTETTEDG